MPGEFFREGIWRDVKRCEGNAVIVEYLSGVDAISGFELFKNSSETRQCLMIFFLFRTKSEGVRSRI